MNAFQIYFIDLIRNKYFNLQGRARRREYWFYVLFYMICSIVLSLVFSLISESLGHTVQAIFGLALLLPSLGVSVRRLHDIGKSGWWLLLALIPFIGAVVLLVFAILDSQPGSNQYGPNPKGL